VTDFVEALHLKATTRFWRLSSAKNAI